MIDYINVVVHGLFFMRASADNTKLELIAPKLKETLAPHKFLGGVRGHLQDLELDPSKPTDWTNVGLIGSPKAHPENVKLSILQFSISENSLGGWNSNYFGGIIVLPWPKDFYSLRCDFVQRTFLFEDSGIVGKIRQRCQGPGPEPNPNAKIGLMTCLQYWYDTNAGLSVPLWRQDLPDLNLHCYYEPCSKHSVGQVSADLNDAGNLFMNPGNFKFQLKAENGGIFTARGERCPAQPPGINDVDDYTLSEDPEVKAQGKCGSTAAQGSALDNFNPANCPSFFVSS